MKPATAYHLYNRGNQQQPIFFGEKNYYYFLDKVRKTFVDDIQLLAYCLMPNHFHLLALTEEQFNPDRFSKRLRAMLSSYTRGIQRQEKFVGSLFQQNTKKKPLPEYQDVFNCFQYIHQNPIRANLTTHLESWPYSSFNEYYLSKPDLCNINLGRSLLDLPSAQSVFYQQSVQLMQPFS